MSDRNSTLDAPYTARERQVLNSFGVVVATCLDASTARDMAEGLTLLRHVCERAWPGIQRRSTAGLVAEVPVPLLQEGASLLGLREQGWEKGTRR